MFLCDNCNLKYAIVNNNKCVFCNIISILDVIIEFSNIYIIKPYYKIKLIDANINDFIKIKQIIRGMKFLFDKNIDFEQININNIYYDDKNNLLKLSPFLSPPIIQKNILYGSPLYSPPEFLSINKSERENSFIIILKSIFYELSFNDNIYINKLFSEDNDNNIYSLIDIYYFFEKNKLNKDDFKDDSSTNLLKLKKINNINILNDEMFIMEI